MKTFFGGVFIDENKLSEEGIEYPIKLEYFRTLRNKENVENKYGIQVVKTEYLEDDINIESKEIKDITNRQDKIGELLDMLKENEVTPITLEDVLEDLNTTTI